MNHNTENFKKYIFLYFRMDFEPNPWNVISIEAFHFYNCPECEDKYVTKEQFVGHAMISHQKARVPLLAILDEKIQISTIESVPDIKQETSTEQDPIYTEKIKVEPISDTETDETFDNASNFEATSDIETDASTIEDNKEDIPLSALKTHKKPIQGPFKIEVKKIKHETMHHDFASIDKGKGKNECLQCGKRFITPSKLQRHQLVHTGEKPFTCKICKKGFTQPTHLKNHVKNHHRHKVSNCTNNCNNCNVLKSKLAEAVSMGTKSGTSLLLPQVTSPETSSTSQDSCNQNSNSCEIILD